MAGNSYSVNKSRIQQGYYSGFELEEDGRLTVAGEEPVHYLCLRAIDSAALDSTWGRLNFEASFSENMVCYLYVAALNEDSFYRNGQPVAIERFLCDSREEIITKKEFFQQVEGLRFVNQKDVLLYGLQGRYLYLLLELTGLGEGWISNIRVDLQGDNFMNTFPEIYRERGGFFHRYISVFSSIYNDFQKDIEALPGILDPDTCQADLLPIYGSWLGIRMGDKFLEEDVLRTLVKEAYRLNRMKGTKAVLERIAEIVLGEKVMVLERNVMEDYIEKEQMAEFEKLYGNSAYDVTILVGESITEVQKSQLLFLLDQFKPVRSRLHIIRRKKAGILDSYSYLDMDARISGQQEGSLDAGQELDGFIRLN